MHISLTCTLKDKVLSKGYIFAINYINCSAIVSANFFSSTGSESIFPIRIYLKVFVKAS